MQQPTPPTHPSPWRCPSRIASIIAALCLSLAPSARATQNDASAFSSTIQPLLKTHCLECHSHDAGKMKGNLALDSRAAALQGGDSGPAIVPAKPSESLLLQAVDGSHPDLQMPPRKGGRAGLSTPEIDSLRSWIIAGAPWPENPSQKMVARERDKISAKDRQWWAIQPISNPTIPAVGAQNAVDAFIEAGLRKNGLVAAPEADPYALLRRVTFDLTGLPPTPEEIEAFENNPSPQAFADAVDRLLDSPRHGVKWARHWLDLVRFAESDGYRIDSFRPEAFRYRDYVIRSFQEDKPYDRFLREQLAGDELYPDDPEALTATGFLRLGPYEYNNRDAVGQWNLILDETTDVVGDVFMGVGVQCARCHDHKFDPILQKDYFRLRAAFAPLRWRDNLHAATPEQRAAWQRGHNHWLSLTTEQRRALAEMEAGPKARAKEAAIKKFPDDIQPILRSHPSKLSPRDLQIHDLGFRQVLEEWDHLLNYLRGDDKDRYIRLQRDLAAFDTQKPKPLPRILAVSDVGPAAPETRIPKKDRLGDIAPGPLSILDAAPFCIPEGSTSTGRRAALAEWLTQKSNPLTARVIVNRVWQHHFGKPLTTSASDLGTLGGPPSHPELLDWLAHHFMENGWSIKWLHRTLLNTHAYRRESRVSNPAHALRIDPENRLLWRMNPRRLSSDEVRDSALFLTGELQLHRSLGEPSVPWDSPARSLFVRTLRNSRDPLLESLDTPDGILSTPERNATTTPPQALTFLHGNWLLKRASQLAATLARESSKPADIVQSAYLRVFNRPPSEPELLRATIFLASGATPIPSVPLGESASIHTERMPFREGKSLVFGRDSGLERLVSDPTTKLRLGDRFTIEAHLLLDSIHPDNQIRTIVSRWEKGSPGWSLGITGKQSSYKPQTLVLLLNGDGARIKDGDPVFSTLHLKTGRPYYIAVTVQPTQEGSQITFKAKDLSDDDQPIQECSVDCAVHANFGGVAPVCIGAQSPDSPRHLWEGLIDDVRISNNRLPQEALLLHSSETLREDTLSLWRFESRNGNPEAVLADEGPAQMRLRETTGAQRTARDSSDAAGPLRDFCHILLNANEFIYLD